MSNTTNLFMQALKKGLENANNAEKFITDLNVIITDANKTLSKIKKEDSKIYFSFVELHDFNGKREISNNSYSGKIIINIDDKIHDCIKVISLAQGFKIDYNKESYLLDFPNIDEFEELFKNYLSSSNFGELIYYSVDKEKMH